MTETAAQRRARLYRDRKAAALAKSPSGGDDYLAEALRARSTAAGRLTLAKFRQALHDVVRAPPCCRRERR